MEHLQEFRREWGSVLALWQGGLTLYGGIIAGTFAGLLAADRFGLPKWLVADALTPSLALGTMFGRIGCFLNGCCYGRPTAMPWGIKFPHDSFAALEFGDTPVQPSQLYNAAVGFILFALLWALRRRFKVPGVMFWTFILSFALVRIPIDLTRTWEADARHDECFAANTHGAEQIARVCRIAGIPYVTFSSDLVFDGLLGRPYLEADLTSPPGAYGHSNAEAGRRVLASHADRVSVRPRHVLSL